MQPRPAAQSEPSPINSQLCSIINLRHGMNGEVVEIVDVAIPKPKSHESLPDSPPIRCLSWPNSRSHSFSLDLTTGYDAQSARQWRSKHAGPGALLGHELAEFARWTWLRLTAQGLVSGWLRLLHKTFEIERASRSGIARELPGAHSVTGLTAPVVSGVLTASRPGCARRRTGTLYPC